MTYFRKVSIEIIKVDCSREIRIPRNIKGLMLDDELVDFRSVPGFLTERRRINQCPDDLIVGTIEFQTSTMLQDPPDFFRRSPLFEKLKTIELWTLRRQQELILELP